MPKVIADIVSHEELIERFEQELNATQLTASDALQTLGDRIRQIVNKTSDYSDDALQECIHDAAILFVTLPEKVKSRVMASITNEDQQDLNLGDLGLDSNEVHIMPICSILLELIVLM